MTHSEIDDVKWRVAELLGESFGLFSEDEIAELEAVLRTDDPEERQRLYDKWADTPAIEHGDPPLPDCFECRRPMRFSYPPQCEEHPTSRIRLTRARVVSASASESRAGPPQRAAPGAGGRETAGIRPDCLMPLRSHGGSAMERDPRPMDNEDDPMPAPGSTCTISQRALLTTISGFHHWVARD